MPDGNESLLREVLAAQSATDAKLAGLLSQVEVASRDAREARDLGNRIATILEEQNIIARLAEHRAEQRQIVSEIRQDFVAANTTLRRDFSEECEARRKADQALEARIEALEASRNKAIGVADFFAWLARVAPWLFAGVAAFIAGIGMKGEG